VTYTISKTFEFSASHQLSGLPAGHQCARLHGHNYVVRLELAADHLDTTGFVLDYGDLKPFKTWIDEHLDHRHLNDQFGTSNPTAEHLAHELHRIAYDVLPIPATVRVAVAVSETPKTWAEYRP
jgi:6-pyruvoyltetrahydropterin/6-carboxytetrahydropterin synthase